MPPRKGMTADYQNIGFGGLCFATDLNFMNIPMSYEQRLWALEGMYYCILGKIEEDEKYKNDSNLDMLIAGTRLLLNQAGKDYRSDFESHLTFGQDENDYRTLLCQIFGKLTQIQGKTKMIERERMVQEEIG